MSAANQFNWRLPLYGVFGALVVFLPTIIFGNDIVIFLLTPLIAVLVALILLVVLVRTVRRQSLAGLSMLVAFCAVSWVLFRVSGNVRDTGRWLIHSKQYKSRVLAQPDSPGGELKHTEWDGWGFAGEDTTVYLVFDPNDSLAAAARAHSPGNFGGIPCKVVNIRRLESHWYTVLFYTDTDWNHCT